MFLEYQPREEIVSVTGEHLFIGKECLKDIIGLVVAGVADLLLSFCWTERVVEVVVDIIVSLAPQLGCSSYSLHSRGVLS